MIVVVDTNVVVSALLKVHAAPARILDMLLLGRMSWAYDDRILAEYSEVLSRPRFGRVFVRREREDLLAFVRHEGRHVVATPLAGLGPAVPDPDDLPFAETAVAAGAAALITGNIRHFAFFSGNPWGIRVLAPAEALAALCGPA